MAWSSTGHLCALFPREHRNHMPRVAGIDGCPGAWLCVVKETGGIEVVGIAIPIGLLEIGEAGATGPGIYA